MSCYLVTTMAFAIVLNSLAALGWSYGLATWELFKERAICSFLATLFAFFWPVVVVVLAVIAFRSWHSKGRFP